ncbi:hypothetical protein [Glycomyces xiaoerkulensis]|uniref:hypothetical protein n=1 Tax=Glycomyces xiaoerkulensis TaxID=2038139 RepID=UPI000C25AB2F|nr:hypothetical protein [Glycomyces xiaoerkulensis]
MSPDTAAKRPTGSKPGPAHRSGSARTWTYLTFAAAAAFAAALILIATRLFVNVAEVSDTPERSVEEFLTALLDDRDSAAASEWLCSAKADRDLNGAVEALAEAGGGAGIDWSNVTEVDRSVGEATVTADLTTGGGDTTTWTFILVAEDSSPQWLVCGFPSQ